MMTGLAMFGVFALRWVMVSILAVTLLLVCLAGYRAQQEREWRRRVRRAQEERQREAIRRAVLEASAEIRLSQYATPNYGGALRGKRRWVS